MVGHRVAWGDPLAGGLSSTHHGHGGRPQQHASTPRHQHASVQHPWGVSDERGKQDGQIFCGGGDPAVGARGREAFQRFHDNLVALATQIDEANVRRPADPERPWPCNTFNPKVLETDVCI